MGKRFFITLLALTVSAALFATPALSGPLDRQNTGPRVNPAAEKMMRVPGVVGMRYQDAMTTLQQAGLNAFVKVIKKYDKRHEGKEGLVVSQIPLAGGVAMLGSSVTVVSYVPEQQAQTTLPKETPAENYTPVPVNDSGSTPHEGHETTLPKETPAENYTPAHVNDSGSTLHGGHETAVPWQEGSTQEHEDSRSASDGQTGTVRGESEQDEKSGLNEEDSGQKKAPALLRPDPDIVKHGAVEKTGVRVRKDKGPRISAQDAEKDEETSSNNEPVTLKLPAGKQQSDKTDSEFVIKDGGGVKEAGPEKDSDSSGAVVSKPESDGSDSQVKDTAPSVKKPKVRKHIQVKDLKLPVLKKPDTVKDTKSMD